MSFLPLDSILTLVGYLGLGFLAGKLFSWPQESLGKVLLFILLPPVVFGSLVTSQIQLSDFLLPLISFGIAATLSVMAWLAMKWVGVTSPSKNILAFASGNSNSGYFGFPIALALFGEEGLAYAILYAQGFVIYENTFALYFASRAHLSPKEALHRVVRLPALWAFVLALVWKFGQWSVPSLVVTAAPHLRSTYTVLGMMLLGLGLTKVQWHDWDRKFLTWSLGFKFFMWPLAAFLVSMFLEGPARRGLLLVGPLPMAANTVAVASALNLLPGRASLAVALSTGISLVLIPLFLHWVL
jgi:predicted permease